MRRAALLGGGASPIATPFGGGAIPIATLFGGGAIPIADTEIKKEPTLADRPLASLSS